MVVGLQQLRTLFDTNEQFIGHYAMVLKSVMFVVLYGKAPWQYPPETTMIRLISEQGIMTIPFTLLY